MKKHFSFRWIGFAVLLAGLSQGPLSAIGIEVAPGGAIVYPFGQIGYQGAELDLKNDLGFKEIGTFSGRVKADLPLFIPNLYFSALPMTFTGRGSRSASFTFGDRTFARDASFDTSLKLDTYDITLFYGIPFLKAATDEKLNVELGLNARIIDFKAEISQPSSNLKESKRLLLGVPMAYAGIQIKPVDSVKIEGEVRGIAYESNRYIDAAGRLKVFLYKELLFVSGGYKYQNLKIDRDSVFVDVEFSGPVFEIGLEF